MSGPKSQTTDDEAYQSLSTPTADFGLEPLSGLYIRSDGVQGDIWLSWEETQQLAKFLREHVGS